MNQLTIAIRNHLDAHRTRGYDWPADAEFALVVRFSAWPVGWQPLAGVTFHTCRADFDKAVQRHLEFAKLEDNHVAYQGYKWELGPVKMPDVARDTEQLFAQTWAEYDAWMAARNVLQP